MTARQRKAVSKPFMVSRPMNKYYDEKLTAFLDYLPHIKSGTEQPTPTSAYDSLLNDRSSRTQRYRTTYRPISQY